MLGSVSKQTQGRSVKGWTSNYVWAFFPSPVVVIQLNVVSYTSLFSIVLTTETCETTCKRTKSNTQWRSHLTDFQLCTFCRASLACGNNKRQLQ